jgi:hypothetical protein
LGEFKAMKRDSWAAGQASGQPQVLPRLPWFIAGLVSGASDRTHRPTCALQIDLQELSWGAEDDEAWQSPVAGEDPTPPGRSQLAAVEAQFL